MAECELIPLDTGTPVIQNSATPAAPTGMFIGPGVARGGTAGQQLTKKSATNYDTEWKDDTSIHSDATHEILGLPVKTTLAPGDSLLGEDAATGSKVQVPVSSLPTGGGHTIKNALGTALPTRSSLKFKGSKTEDIGGKTVNSQYEAHIFDLVPAAEQAKILARTVSINDQMADINTLIGQLEDAGGGVLRLPHGVITAGMGLSNTRPGVNIVAPFSGRRSDGMRNSPVGTIINAIAGFSDNFLVRLEPLPSFDGGGHPWDGNPLVESVSGASLCNVVLQANGLVPYGLVCTSLNSSRIERVSIYDTTADGLLLCSWWGPAYRAWETGRPYAAWSVANRTIYARVSYAGSVYRCAIAHTAGTFATDLAAGKWVLEGAVGAVPLQVPLLTTQAGYEENFNLFSDVQVWNDGIGNNANGITMLGGYWYTIFRQCGIETYGGVGIELFAGDNCLFDQCFVNGFRAHEVIHTWSVGKVVEIGQLVTYDSTDTILFPGGNGATYTPYNPVDCNRFAVYRAIGAGVLGVDPATDPLLELAGDETQVAASIVVHSQFKNLKFTGGSCANGTVFVHDADSDDLTRLHESGGIDYGNAGHYGTSHQFTGLDPQAAHRILGAINSKFVIECGDGTSWQAAGVNAVSASNRGLAVAAACATDGDNVKRPANTEAAHTLISDGGNHLRFYHCSSYDFRENGHYGALLSVDHDWQIDIDPDTGNLRTQNITGNGGVKQIVTKTGTSGSEVFYDFQGVYAPVGNSSATVYALAFSVTKTTAGNMTGNLYGPLFVASVSGAGYYHRIVGGTAYAEITGDDVIVDAGYNMTGIDLGPNRISGNGAYTPVTIAARVRKASVYNGGDIGLDVGLSFDDFGSGYGAYVTAEGYLRIYGGIDVSKGFRINGVEFGLSRPVVPLSGSSNTMTADQANASTIFEVSGSPSIEYLNFVGDGVTPGATVTVTRIDGYSSALKLGFIGTNWYFPDQIGVLQYQTTYDLVGHTSATFEWSGAYWHLQSSTTDTQAVRNTADASVTSGRLVIMDGTTGKLVKQATGSGVTGTNMTTLTAGPTSYGDDLHGHANGGTTCTLSAETGQLNAGALTPIVVPLDAADTVGAGISVDTTGATQKGRVTVSVAGRYVTCGAVGLRDTAATADTFYVFIDKNNGTQLDGTWQQAVNTASGTVTMTTGTIELTLAAGDYLTMRVQRMAANKNFKAQKIHTSFTLRRLYAT